MRKIKKGNVFRSVGVIKKQHLLKLRLKSEARLIL
jgi:hypothetical protein